MFVFPFQTICDWFSREQFLSTCTFAYALFIKRQKANSLEDITIIVKAEKVYFAGQECFSAAQGRSAGTFCREEIIDELRIQVKTKLLRAKFRQLFSVIRSTGTLSYPHTTTGSTPTRRRVCVCWREGEGDTPSYKLYNQVSLLDISLRNVSEFAYRLMKVEVSHLYLPQSYALYNMISFEIGYCNQSDGFISHISPGIVINISGNQLVWYWMGVGIIIGFQ